MANIIDYLEWRGDLKLSADGFNEVDNLILSELAYCDFDNINNIERELLPLDKVYEEYFKLHSHEEIQNRKTIIGRMPLLLDKLIETNRFKDLRLGYYKNKINKDAVVQFSAVTYVLDDLVYIAFRGTDNSLIGWKEDFYFSYKAGTSSQIAAVNYLNNIGKNFAGNLHVGGHSKGGNLAIYASGFCEEEIQKRIAKIWGNDSPGFTGEDTLKTKLQNIVDRVYLIIPQFSVVGMLMEHQVKAHIVKSDSKNIWQHDGQSWQVKGKTFERADSLDSDAVFINKAINTWLKNIPVEKRKQAVDSVFYCLDAAQVATFMELKDGGINSIKEIIAAAKTLPDDQYSLIMDLAGQLISDSKDLVLENIKESVSLKKNALKSIVDEKLKK